MQDKSISHSSLSDNERLLTMQHSTHTVLPCQALDGVVRYVSFKTVGNDLVAGSSGRIVQPYGKAWRADPEFVKLSPAATQRAWLQTPAE